MIHSMVKWLVLFQLFLNEQALCKGLPHLALKHDAPIPRTILIRENMGSTPQEQQQPLLRSQLQFDALSVETSGPIATSIEKEDRVKYAKRMISILRARLMDQVGDDIRIRGNVSCAELLSATTMDDKSSTLLPQELLGLSLVPVLVVAHCQEEAQTLVLKLYHLLGVGDAEELLMEVEDLIQRRMSHFKKPHSGASMAPLAGSAQTDGHLAAVMFNIQQLAGAKLGKQAVRCKGWTRVNGTTLIGRTVEGATGGLGEAVRACESLRSHCAGVTPGGLLKPGKYVAVLRKGSRVVPSESPASESWIRWCDADKNSSPAAAGGGRRQRRSAQRNCINKREERVYNVVEWIPAVSTLYNLGTAMYYASLNCTETAKERAILSAVDLGTDALMAATGGAAGVAGYALGAGMKTGVKAGVKYLLSSIKQEDDLLVNQHSWEQGPVH